MLVPVAVWTRGHHFVGVIVVPIVVGMGVFVFQRHVFVFMLVSFGLSCPLFFVFQGPMVSIET